VCAFGLDVHRDFCEVAFAADGRIRSAGRIPTRVAALELFAQSLVASDVVAREATTGADKIVALLQAYGIRVVVGNTRKFKSITEAKAKTTGSTRGRRACCRRVCSMSCGHRMSGRGGYGG
jgi:transposase